MPTSIFSDDHDYNRTLEGDWKVVLGTDVRGGRGDSEHTRADVQMLAIGWDSDFLHFQSIR